MLLAPSRSALGPAGMRYGSAGNELVVVMATCNAKQLQQMRVTTCHRHWQTRWGSLHCEIKGNYDRRVYRISCILMAEVAMNRTRKPSRNLFQQTLELNGRRELRVLGPAPRPTPLALSARRNAPKETIESKVDAVEAFLAEIRSLPKNPPRRTYTLEHIDGEWAFRRNEAELAVDAALEAAFGLEPDPDDDRRYGFKLPQLDRGTAS